MRCLFALLSLLLALGCAARNPRGTAAPVFQACAGGPVLTPGTWANITPPAPGIGSTNFGTISLAIDPNNHAILYEVVDQGGLWQSINCGASWAVLGTPPAVNAGPGNSYTTPYLDSPIEVLVDPADSTHLVATQGVRGTSQGFWVSHNSGTTWTMPTSFYNLCCGSSPTATVDVTELATDPSNWNHMIMTGHSSWPGLASSGVYETTDAGVTWTLHAPVASWTSSTHFIAFLYNPATSQGNSQTWLVGDSNSDGYWKTENSGTSWTQVSTKLPIHGGGNQVTYTADGTVFTAAAPYPIFSVNNGDSWAQVNSSGLTNSQFYFIGYDGNTLYTMPANAANGYITQPYNITPGSTGASSAWTNYSVQTFTNGPFQMYWDSTTRVMYAAMWSAGVWALRVTP